MSHYPQFVEHYIKLKSLQVFLAFSAITKAEIRLLSMINSRAFFYIIIWIPSNTKANSKKKKDHNSITILALSVILLFEEF